MSMKKLFDKAEVLSHQPETVKVIKQTRTIALVTTVAVIGVGIYAFITRGKLVKSNLLNAAAQNAMDLSTDLAEALSDGGAPGDVVLGAANKVIEGVGDAVLI